MSEDKKLGITTASRTYRDADAADAGVKAMEEMHGSSLLGTSSEDADDEGRIKVTYQIAKKR